MGHVLYYFLLMCFSIVDCLFVVLRAPSTWNGQTLEDLEILPLYLTQPFYEKFDTVCHVTHESWFFICVHFKVPDNVQSFVFCNRKSNRQ